MKGLSGQILALVFGLALCCEAAADPSVNVLDASTLSKVYTREQWSMVLVDLENSGDEPTKLDVVLSVRKGLHEVNYVKRVYLPARCRRLAWFPAQLGPQKSYPLKLLNLAGGEVASSTELSYPLPWQRLLILTIDDRGVLPRLKLYVTEREAHQRKPGVGGGAVRLTSTASTRLPDFPDRWAGLDSMSVVAMGPLDHEQWRPSQVDALVAWLESGGVLLFFPGTDIESLKGSRVEKLLPVRVFGSRKQNHLTLQDSLNRWEVPLKDYGDVLEVEVRQGETILRSGELPMVVRRRMGMGAIYFFAFPGSALDQWKQRGPLLARVLRSHERLKPFSQSGLADKGPEMLDDVAGAEVAPPSFVVITLGIFSIIVVLSLLVTRWRGRSEVAWAVIIPVGLVIAVIAYRVGVSYRKKVGLSLNEIAVLSTSSASSRAFKSAVLGIHTEKNLKGELVATCPNTLFTANTHGAREGGKVSREFLEVGPVLRLTNLRISGGDFPRYVVDSILDLGGSVVADLQLGEGGISGTITNNTPMELRNCLCAVNSYPYLVGDLSPGQSVRVRFSDDNVKSKADFTAEAVLGSRSRTRKLIITNLFKTDQEHVFAPWAQRLFMLGWADRGFACEELLGVRGKDVTRRSISVLCVEVLVRPATAGTAVHIPRAFCTAALRPVGSFGTFGLSSLVATAMPTRAELHFYLPEFASNVEVSEAELHISARAPGYTLVVRGRDQQAGGAIELARWENPAGRESILIEGARRFQHTAKRALVLELEVIPVERESAGPAKQPPGWSLREASVALRGIAR